MLLVLRYVFFLRLFLRVQKNTVTHRLHVILREYFITLEINVRATDISCIINFPIRITLL